MEDEKKDYGTLYSTSIMDHQGQSQPICKNLKICESTERTKFIRSSTFQPLGIVLEKEIIG